MQGTNVLFGQIAVVFGIVMGACRDKGEIHSFGL